MTFTKGPWKAHPYNLRMGTLVSFGDITKGETIAAVVAQKDADEGRANGHIVAAAPDLYEALKFAKEIIDDQAKRFHKDCRCQLCESLPMAIDAAIAKAEGK